MFTATPLPRMGSIFGPALRSSALRSSIGECSMCRGLGLEEKFPAKPKEEGGYEGDGHEHDEEIERVLATFEAYLRSQARGDIAVRLSFDPDDSAIVVAVDALPLGNSLEIPSFFQVGKPDGSLATYRVREAGSDSASAYEASVGADLSSKCARPFPPYVWTKQDYDALRAAAAKLNAAPRDLLLVLALESDLNPHAANCWPAGTYPNAAGLNQITKVSSDAMGLTEAQRVALLDMTAAEQLPYVARSFLAARGGKPFDTPPGAVTLYQTNIAPATVPNEVLYVSPSVNYTANKGLDADGDGKITRADLKTVLQRVALSKVYQRGLAELEGMLPPAGGDGTGGGSSETNALLLGGGALAAAGYLAYRSGWLKGLVG